MELTMKTGFDELVSNYKTDLATYNNRVADVQKQMETARVLAMHSSPGVLRGTEPTPDYASKYYSQLGQLEQNMHDTDKKYNVDLQSLILNNIESLKQMTNDREDFQLRFQNALNYITMIGDRLTDEQAWRLVSPLFGDYATMENLYIILNGRNNLPVTLAALNGYSSVVANLKTSLEQSTNLFQYRDFSSLGKAWLIGDLETNFGKLNETLAFADQITQMTFKEAGAKVNWSMFDWETYRNANTL